MQILCCTRIGSSVRKVRLACPKVISMQNALLCNNIIIVNYCYRIPVLYRWSSVKYVRRSYVGRLAVINLSLLCILARVFCHNYPHCNRAHFKSLTSDSSLITLPWCIRWMCFTRAHIQTHANTRKAKV